MQTPPSVGVPQTSTTWSCLCPLSAGCGSMCEHNLTCSSAWSGAWLGSSSGQFRRQSWLGVRWVSDLKPYANLICGILIYELNCQGGSSVKLPKVFPVAQVRHVHAGALYIPEQFGASFGILCMSRSCWLRQDSLLCWMPNQAAASFFLVSFFFRFFAVLFGLAVFKFFFSCCCGETAGGDFTLNPVLSPEIWFCCLRCCFCCGCRSCCCYSVYLSICRVRVRECVRECECVLGMCGRLSGYQRWHKSFIYQPQLVLLAGVLGAPCLMNTHKVANEATSRKSGKGSAHTHSHTDHIFIHMFIYTYIHMYEFMVGIYEYIHKTA